MIVTKLMGGLGNQMFQFAAGKSLAVKHSVPLFVDTSFLTAPTEGRYTKRHLELQQLNVELNIADQKILAGFDRSILSSISKLFSGKLRRSGRILTDPHQVRHSFFQTGNHVYLNGFWQSELYFDKIRSVIKKEFTPNFDLNKEGGKIRESILRASQAVSIHVRRGDYVELKEANQFHGVCDLNYYKTAILHMTGKIGKAEFFIFSDDIAWCRSNFKDLADCTFVETRSSFSSLDLFLMADCKHHIIANSSYSWWGAWLSSNERKLVIAPQSWFTDPNFGPDIYCKDWIRL